MGDNDAQFKNEADFLGSLYYNINAMTGFMLYTPDRQHAALYSDMMHTQPLDGKTMTDYATGKTVTNEEAGDIWKHLNYDETYKLAVMTPDEYKAIEPYYTLLGLSWLPWFPIPQDEKGNRLRRYDVKNRTRFNKARWEVLEPTLMTVGKLTAAALLGLSVVKFAFNQISRRFR